MPLSNDARFGVQAMTEAVNALPVTPTQIRDLQLFKPVYLSTTYVNVEEQEGQLNLVQSKERGSQGDPSISRTRKMKSFKIPHLPKDDVVLAEDVQNIRGFGTTQAQTVESTVNDKLADMKSDLEYTREHLALGALQGLILDANGDVLFDLNAEFGLTRTPQSWALGNDGTKVGGKIDQTITALRKKLKGEMVSKWVCLCGAEFMEKLKYHDSIKALYERYRDGATYREGSLNHISFEHNGVQFIQYDGEFGTDADIATNKGSSCHWVRVKPLLSISRLLTCLLRSIPRLWRITLAVRNYSMTKVGLCMLNPMPCL